MFDKFLNYCEAAYNRVHELYKNDEEFRGFIQAYALGSMIGMTGLTICHWLGHPEWALRKNVSKLIVKNMTKK